MRPRIHNKKMVAEIREAVLKHSKNEALADNVVECISAISVSDGGGSDASGASSPTLSSPSSTNAQTVWQCGCGATNANLETCGACRGPRSECELPRETESPANAQPMEDQLRCEDCGCYTTSQLANTRAFRKGRCASCDGRLLPSLIKEQTAKEEEDKNLGEKGGQL